MNPKGIHWESRVGCHNTHISSKKNICFEKNKKKYFFEIKKNENLVNMKTKPHFYVKHGVFPWG